jgi:Tol biopolymer transport system component
VALEPGHRLLHYRLIEKIGEGGMGVVWRAFDTSLEREVAIKVLPDGLVDDPGRLDRFEREAKILASLNHPHIAMVFGVHEADGTHFLAMELVPGEDLAQRLRRGRLSIGAATDIARRIAEGLEAAHERGVVHRDLKPANILISPDGAVKILDFGLAKTAGPSPREDLGPLQDPTLSLPASVTGMLVGTAAYMSPEQALGDSGDMRSDIWAFGCVLWECLTGKRLFGGDTAADSLQAIFRRDPKWDELPVDTPPSVRRLLRRCLAKDPRQRLHHIADARLELSDADDAQLPAGKTSPRWILGAVAALVLAASIALPILLRPAAAPGSPDTNPLARARFTKITNLAGNLYDAAISPDGRFVAFVSERDRPRVLFGQIGTGEFRDLTENMEEFDANVIREVRRIGFTGDGSDIWFGGGSGLRMQLIPLLGGQVRNFLGVDVVNVAWSPDGERIVYHERLAGDPLWVADRNGENARLLATLPAGMHQHYPTWSVDGQWIYLTRGRPATGEMDLWRVRVDDGTSERLTQNKINVSYPTPIDEQTVLFCACDADGAGPWLWVVDVETKHVRRASVGLEVFSSVAASADRKRLVATLANPRADLWHVPILDHRVATEADAELLDGTRGRRALAPRIARDSSLYFLSSQGGGDGLSRFQRGKITEIWSGSETALLEPPAISPNGEAVVLLLRTESGWRLHIRSADGAQLRLLSDEVDARGAADWSPDGRWIVTGGSVDGAAGLYKIQLDGGAPQRLVDGDAMDPVWSPAGDLIVYTGTQIEAVAQLKSVRPDGRPVELPKIDVMRGGERARFLPDGSGLVYMQGLHPAQDFWQLDLATMATRQLTRLEPNALMRTFDVEPDGKNLVFDRLSDDSDVVLIELDRPR